MIFIMALNRISVQEPDQGIMRQVSDTLSGAIEG